MQLKKIQRGKYSVQVNRDKVSYTSFHQHSKHTHTHILQHFVGKRGICAQHRLLFDMVSCTASDGGGKAEQRCTDQHCDQHSHAQFACLIRIFDVSMIANKLLIFLCPKTTFQHSLMSGIMKEQNLPLYYMKNIFFIKCPAISCRIPHGLVSKYSANRC